MNIQLDESVLISALGSASLAIITLILLGVWRLLEVFRHDLDRRIVVAERGIEDRQEAWRRMLEAHVNAEAREFEGLYQLKAEVKMYRDDFIAAYATKKEVSEQLETMLASIEEIRKIVDSRSQRRADPVSGRTPQEK